MTKQRWKINVKRGEAEGWVLPVPWILFLPQTRETLGKLGSFSRALSANFLLGNSWPNWRKEAPLAAESSRVRETASPGPSEVWIGRSWRGQERTGGGGRVCRGRGRVRVGIVFCRRGKGSVIWWRCETCCAALPHPAVYPPVFRDRSPKDFLQNFPTIFATIEKLRDETETRESVYLHEGQEITTSSCIPGNWNLTTFEWKDIPEVTSSTPL